MAKSLIEELPRIVNEGRREAQQILERLSSGTQIGLQTNELVLPSKDVSGLFKGSSPQIPNAFNDAVGEDNWMNRLIYGDNLLAMQALLAGDASTGLPSLRGKVDLIYIDPPFDSKADYRTKINLPGTDIEQKPTVIEQFAYAVRKHWSIENQLHWRLDVIFREDAARARKDLSPLNLNVLRKVALALCRNAEFDKRVSLQKRRYWACLDPVAFLRILFG